MALNLSTLTSPATSGDVLAEIELKADNLDLVPVLRNLGQGASNATQDTALNQPIAHVPVNGGHLYLSGVVGNYASVPDAANLDGFGDFTIQVDGVTSTDWTPSVRNVLISKYKATAGERGWRFRIDTDGKLNITLSFDGAGAVDYTSTAPVGLAARFSARQMSSPRHRLLLESPARSDHIHAHSRRHGHNQPSRQ
jgi:hypothetical protein